MRAIAVTLSIATLLAACGGGHSDSSNIVVVTNEPVEPARTESDRYADDRLRNLKKLAQEAVQQIPSFGDYDKLIQAAKGENDGGDALLAAAARHASLGDSGDNEPWQRLLKFGEGVFRAGLEREPTKEEREEALFQSAGVAMTMQELQRYDSLIIRDRSPEAEETGLVMKFFLVANGRVPILLASGYSAKAAEELAMLLDTLAKLDGGLHDTSSTRRYLVRLNLVMVCTDKLAPLAGYPEVVHAFEALRKNPVAEFKRKWRLEAAEWVWRILNAEKPEDIWASFKPDTRAYEWLQFHIAVAKMFPDRAPDPFDAEEYARAKAEAGKIGGRILEESFATLARAALEDERYWLLWDLFRADAKSPLLGRKAEAEAMIANVPYAVGEWTDTELKISLDPECPILADANMDTFDRPYVIKLRPKS